MRLHEGTEPRRPCLLHPHMNLNADSNMNLARLKQALGIVFTISLPSRRLALCQRYGLVDGLIAADLLAIEALGSRSGSRRARRAQGGRAISAVSLALSYAFGLKPGGTIVLVGIALLLILFAVRKAMRVADSARAALNDWGRATPRQDRAAGATETGSFPQLA